MFMTIDFQELFFFVGFTLFNFSNSVNLKVVSNFPIIESWIYISINGKA